MNNTTFQVWRSHITGHMLMKKFDNLIDASNYYLKRSEGIKYAKHYYLTTNLRDHTQKQKTIKDDRGFLMY